MKTKLLRVGEELAIVVDLALLEKVGIKSDSELEITVEDGRLVIAKPGTRRRPLPPPPRHPRSPRPGPPQPGPPDPEYGFPKKQPW